MNRPSRMKRQSWACFEATLVRLVGAPMSRADSQLQVGVSVCNAKNLTPQRDQMRRISRESRASRPGAVVEFDLYTTANLGKS